MYKLASISKERWLSISGDDSWYFPDEFFVLLKAYESQLNGTISEVSEDMQYIVSNDPLKLIFQWDSCFGITVIVPDETDMAIAEKTIIDLCNALNQKE